MSFLPNTAQQLEGARFLGIDLAKKESQLSVLDAAGHEVLSLRFATTRDNILALAAELLPTDTVALEVTTNATAIARLLKNNSAAAVILSNPIKTRVIAEAKVKTDKIDARVLAELARVGYLPQVWLPDDDTEALRHLFNDRRSLVDRRTELKNTVHSILHRNLVSYEFSDLFNYRGWAWLKSLASLEPDVPSDNTGLLMLPLSERLRLRSLIQELTHLDEMVGEADASIAAFILARPEKKRQLDLLLSIPGVSLIVGGGFLAAIGDVTRFDNPKQLASYFGLTPTTYQSGDAPQRHGRISKKGRADGRWLAVEAAEHLSKAPGVMRQFYQRIKKRKGRNVAIVAVARKLVELAWHLLTKNEEYIYALPRLTDEKRSRVRFLAKQKVGLQSESAAQNRSFGQTALYRSGLQGRKLKTEIVRQAALVAEARYLALTSKKQTDNTNGNAIEEIGFDPRTPKQLEWEVILAEVAKRIEPSMGAVKKKKTVPADSTGEKKKKADASD